LLVKSVVLLLNAAFAMAISKREFPAIRDTLLFLLQNAKFLNAQINRSTKEYTAL
jgi:hypothetical protein